MFLFSSPSFITVTVLFIVYLLYLSLAINLCVFYFLFVPVTMIYDKQNMIMYFFGGYVDTDLVVFELGIFESLSSGKTEMAFCNKIGNLLRQGATQTSQAPVSSMLNYLRHMSSSKLFIGVITFVWNLFIIMAIY
jgi:hypothetical protein